MTNRVDIIGSRERVNFPELKLRNIPAKVDTGADSSAIWASDVRLNSSGDLEFKLFGRASEFYTGQQLTFRDYEQVLIRNAHGETWRYKLRLSVEIGGRKIRGWFTLADRGSLKYPILIGRRLVKNKFWIDVGRSTAEKDNSDVGSDVLVLGVSAAQTQNFFDELRQRAGVKFTLAGLTQLLYWFDNTNVNITELTSNRDIASFGLVYFKVSKKQHEFATAAASYLSASGVDFIDRALAASVTYDKLGELVKLADAGVPVPRTVGGSNRAILSNLDKIEEFINARPVVKEINSDRGRNNFLLDKFSEVEGVLADSEIGNHFIVQEYVENDGFLRAYVFGRKVALAVLRSPTANVNPRKAHLNKPAGSSNASLVAVEDIDNEARELAIRAAMCLNRQVAGVDLIYDKNRRHWLVLEVNSAPQLRTGSFVDEKLAAFADYFRKELNR